MRALHGATLTCALAVVGLGACRHDIAEIDGSYYGGGELAVHCAVDIDKRTKNTLESVDTGLDRAVERDEVIELFAHQPGVTVTPEAIEHVLAGARDRGLAFVTYADFAAGTAVRPGLALSFDDNATHAWMSIRELLLAYDARVTFFVSRYRALSDEQRAEIRILADDGHAIEAHSVQHLHAPPYVEEHGLDAYLADEVLPSIEALRADGYTPVAFAYPFGMRTSEIDRAILEHVPILRSVSFAWSPVESPCPR